MNEVFQVKNKTKNKEINEDSDDLIETDELSTDAYKCVTTPIKDDSNNKTN